MNALILGGFLFSSVSIGGGIAWLVAKVFRSFNEGLALLCGGFLVGLLALDIIPSAFSVYKSPGIILGVLIGYIFLLLMNKSLHSSGQHKPSVYVLTIALCIHTIPLSLTIGNLLGDSTFAVSITTSTILHHIPEGFALTSVFLSQGQKIKGLFLCFISLSICFSAFIWIGDHVNLSIKAQSVLLGVSIGMIAITSIKEFILPNVRIVPNWMVIVFVLIGYLLSVVFHLLF
ncbi:zinc transporter family protein [Psychrobacillus glaciei]|uniref:Zinc transporter family protein n=1 Tax=Psychrobacillus glaciei TaxID=2283160 RepID=A0A5J6SPC1_9BACI|nr:zinc transporter family protein [Psychrobacillus glaciei]